MLKSGLAPPYLCQKIKTRSEVYNCNTRNRLIIHEGKCDAVLLDTKPFIGPLKPLVWGDKTIEYRYLSVCLGIIIDKRLSWANHVKSVSTSYSSKVKMLPETHKLFIKSHSRNNLLQNSNPKRIICYGCVGLLLRLFDERSRTNPP